LTHLVTIGSPSGLADTEWKPLPAGLWTLPAVFMEAGNLLLEAFMEAGVPTWKVREKASDPLKWNMIAEGTGAACLLAVFRSTISGSSTRYEPDDQPRARRAQRALAQPGGSKISP